MRVAVIAQVAEAVADADLVLSLTGGKAALPAATVLARHSRRTGRWDALVTVKPLHLTGGVGSPANATAIR